MVTTVKSLVRIAGIFLPVLCLSSFTTEPNGKISFKSGKDICLVELCTENIVKVDFRPNGEYSPGTPAQEENKPWGTVKASVSQADDQVVIRTSAMKVKISKTPFCVSVYDAGDLPLISSKKIDPKGGITFLHDSAAIQRQYT